MTKEKFQEIQELKNLLILVEVSNYPMDKLKNKQEIQDELNKIYKNCDHKFSDGSSTIIDDYCTICKKYLKR